MDVAEQEASASAAAATGAAPDPPTEQTVPAPAAAASSCSSDRVPATHYEVRPPRGRVVLLEQTLSAENDERSSLLRAESAIRIKLLEEEHLMKVAEHRVRLQVEQTNLKIAEWKLRELQQGGEK
ncbi:hypothetical protein HPB47_021853 [Ixodes persulcatus]|uniref:Uncharacterized protein n=1 Tax=Ixodes persulcatus TaxID=34615 RepID=A0AC60QCD4_IXOPE|nr:hypothetical protein HPB47_021853 [Ixodes persulcatus]